MARQHGGEMVCADAFQLYREFPVLSAQPSVGERNEIPHHLYGAIPCTQEIDAAHYAGMAGAIVRVIIERGRIPFIVGGSGLYLQALIGGLPEVPSIDPGLRARVRGMTLQGMQAELRELDPQSLLAIDANNPRRVARRLELCLQTGKPASEALAALPPFPEGLRGVFLSRDREDLAARIEAVVRQRLDTGAVEEVRSVRETAGGTARQILGWREIVALLDGKISREECRDRLTAATRRYAKRQLTWFRGKSTFSEEIVSAVTSDTLDRLARRLGLS